MAIYNLKINNRSVQVEAEPDTPLLWVLRDELELKGTKYGCGKALCGACTVHLNGNAVRSCVLPIAALQNAEITTIEGLSENGSHPVQRAWMEVDVPQCGYCQAGQMMTAAALLDRNDDPTDEEIASTMMGNLCRCGTYPRIKKAIDLAIQYKKD